MMKHGQNNDMGKTGMPGKSKNGSNHGASSAPRMAPAGGAPGSTGSRGSVSNKGPFPNGLS